MFADIRGRRERRFLRTRFVPSLVAILVALLAAGDVHASGGGTAVGVLRIRPEAVRPPAGPDPAARDVVAPDLLPPEGIAVGDRRLGGDDVALLEGFTAFLLDRPLTTAERRALHAWIRREFTADPGTFLSELQQLRGAWMRVEAVEDPSMRAMLRQRFVTVFYFAFRALPPARRPAPLTLVLDAHPVIAADAARGILITERELDAYLAFDRFLADLTGTEARLTDIDHELLRASLRDALRAGRPWAERFPSIYPYWVRVETRWRRLAPERRAAFLAEILRNDPLTAFPLLAADEEVLERLERHADEIARGIAESVRPEDIPDEALEEFRRDLLGD